MELVQSALLHLHVCKLINWNHLETLHGTLLKCLIYEEEL